MDRRVELWVREAPPYCVRDVLEETYERVRCLEERGIVGSVSVRTWNNVETAHEPATDHGAVCREKIAEFRDWAIERGYALSPGFQTRKRRSMIDDDVRRELVPPVLCLAAYEGDGLEAVFPHADGGRVHTVADGLDHLEASADGGNALAGGETA